MLSDKSKPYTMLFVKHVRVTLKRDGGILCFRIGLQCCF